MHQPQGATFRLDDGELVRLDPTEAEVLYDKLWGVATDVRGAAAAAAKIRHAQGHATPLIENLGARESAAIRDVLGREAHRLN
jgi:hypothetical protein